MNFSLDNRQKELRAEAITSAQTHLNQGVEERDRTQHFDRGLWNKCGQLQLLGLPIDPQYGGRGLNALDTMIALEGLGYGCRDNGLSFAIGAHMLACSIPIMLFGSEAQKSHFLPKMCDGTWVATNAITETEAGSDVFSMQTTATERDNKYVINGNKNYCSNAPVADVLILYAATDPAKKALGGITGFLLERAKGEFDTSGKIEKMGLRSCEMGKISLNDISVGKDSMIGKTGGGTVQFTQSMLWERIGLSAIHMGTLQRLLEDAIAYTKERNVFDQSIESFQAIGHTLADIHVQLESARLLVYQAAWQLDHGDRASSTSASVAKLFVSEMYKSQTMKLLQVYGAMGYINNTDIERSVRDAAAATLYSGTSEIQRNLIHRKIQSLQNQNDA